MPTYPIYNYGWVNTLSGKVVQQAKAPHSEHNHLYNSFVCTLYFKRSTFSRSHSSFVNDRYYSDSQHTHQACATQYMTIHESLLYTLEQILCCTQLLSPVWLL